jgi:sec-independent protein translocase protein TatB
VLDLSPDKLVMLAVVALVVLGPNRLPAAARTVGRFFGQMRAMSSSFQSEVREALHDHDDVITSTLTELRPAQLRRNVRRAVTDTLAPSQSVATGSQSVATGSQSVATGSQSVATTAVPTPPPAPTGWGGQPVPDDPGFN